MTEKQLFKRALEIAADEIIRDNCQNCPATPCPAHINPGDKTCQKRVVGYYLKKAKGERA